MENPEDGVQISRLPVNVVSFEHSSWHFRATKSHILSSKCTGRSSEECKPEDEGSMCAFCFYSRKLDLPHLPDMVFNANIITLLNNKSGCSVEFNAFDALALVSNGKMTIEVACSEEWKESRNETGHIQNVLKPFDWTFSSDYKGSLKGDWMVETTEETIDVEKLKKKDAILFFHELTLYEDELHDHGIGQLNIKVRVMPEVFFVLMRYFLRVDGVLIKVNDTRLYHDFQTNYIIREYTSRESKVADLKVPPSMFLDPNEIAPHLPLLKRINEKLSLP